MPVASNVGNVTSQAWDLGNLQISHYLIDYQDMGVNTAKNDTEYVRLHFGLQGAYDFTFAQLNASFQLAGHHNNIMYSDGLELVIANKSKRIETFGINMETNTFVGIAQKGNEPLKRLADKVVNRENAILANEWQTNTFRIQSVINEIIHCPYTDNLKDLFLFSKSIELLVLQAELYEEEKPNLCVKSRQDKDKLVAAKEIITSRMDSPPSLNELAKLVSLNEYQLKRGFKEMFGTTVFGHIHQLRMDHAKRLLLGTSKTAKEIAYETGYSSPQHFSKAFKKEFGIPPQGIRNAPDFTIRPENDAPPLGQ
ncbi:MAG TPA: hypothetical protein DCE41_34830 [Cytophagales bacterium]|nr:hypothetical protein [Cytophagales bacterium]HAA22690.1 hypothetical protein [Cytophagales bacterium]HAP59492.1 hypothetical protein [Cytophagales bacterium]